MKAILLLTLVAVIVLGGGWYWWYSENVSNAPTTLLVAAVHEPQGNPAEVSDMVVPDSTATPIVGESLMLATAGSDALGIYLVGYTGMILYTDSKDTATSSSCYGVCAAQWPPYIVSGSDRLNLQYAVNGPVTTIKRTDGKLQLTYNRHPLYFGTTSGAGTGDFSVAKP